MSIIIFKKFLEKPKNYLWPFCLSTQIKISPGDYGSYRSIKFFIAPVNQMAVGFFCSGKFRQDLNPLKIIGCEGCPGFYLISHLPTLPESINQLRFLAVSKKIMWFDTFVHENL